MQFNFKPKNRLIRIGLILLLSVLLVHNKAHSQENTVAIGQWRSHLNYSRTFKSVQAGNLIYCATENGLFYIDLRDNSVKTLSTIDGLSSVRPTQIAYNEKYKALLVAYEGGDLDLITETSIINIPFIYQSSNILGDKEINSISFKDDFAYLSTNFGIVVYDLRKREIKESYINLSSTGNKLNIKDAIVYKDRIYASTPDGLRSAALSTNLLDYNFWDTELIEPCSKLQVFNDELVIAFDSGGLARFNNIEYKPFLDDEIRIVYNLDVYNNQLVITKSNDIEYFNDKWEPKVLKTNAPKHCYIDANGVFWLSTGAYGLLKIDKDEQTFINPNGPSSYTCWDIRYSNDEIWVASGGLDLAYNPRFLNDGFYRFKNNTWNNFNSNNRPELKPFRDFHLVRIDATRKHKYFASYNAGLIELDENNEIIIHDKKSTDGNLQSPGNDTSLTAPIRIAGMDLDTQGNLWMSLQYAERQLAVKTVEDEWYSFNIGNDKRVNDVLIDGYGQKWVVVHLDGIYVFDEGENFINPVDDRVYKYTTAQGTGNLPASDVYAITMDKKGHIWIGTSDGIAVVYDPSSVFENDGNAEAQQVYIEDGGTAGYLLEGQKVNCIAIDGANQKWIGTANGIFVTNEDGNEILHNFTINNSPLLSNQIRNIGIDGKTGEVFIATDRGLISYRAEATEGKDVHEGVFAFPNPVRPDFTGVIGIKGLVENANVKITDIAGAIVYETTAQGGQAVWNGKNFNGSPVSSGVYLVFSTDKLGVETYVTKIMMIK